LPQEPDVVAVKLTNVRDVVAPHAQPFDAQPKREACDLFRIVSHSRQDVGIDHARPAEFDPRIIPLKVNFDAWFREGEK
jgi:hypothetical protein